MRLSKINSYFGPIQDMRDVCRAILESLLGKGYVVTEDVSKVMKSIKRFDPRLDNILNNMILAVPDAFHEQIKETGEEPDYESIRGALEVALKQVDENGRSISDLLRRQLARYFRSSHEVLNTTGKKAQDELVILKVKNEINMWLNYIAKVLFDNWDYYLSPPEDNESFERFSPERQEYESEKLVSKLRSVPSVRKHQVVLDPEVGSSDLETAKLRYMG